jgi:tetratricopeptide (TPR) repeat protein
VARCDHRIAAGYLRMEKPATAIEVLDRGLKLSQAGDYKAVSMDLYRGLGGAQRTLGNLDAAASATERSLSLARELHDRPGELSALNNRAIVHGDTGDLRQAIMEYNETLRIAESLGAQDRLAGILLNLGIEYDYQGDPEISLAHLERALREAREPRDQALVFAQPALVQGQLRKDAEAMNSYERALKLSPQVSDQITEAATLFHRSDFFRERGRWTEALSDAKAGLALVDSTQNPWWFCEGLIKRALAEAERGDARAGLVTAARRRGLRACWARRLLCSPRLKPWAWLPSHRAAATRPRQRFKKVLPLWRPGAVTLRLISFRGRSFSRTRLACIMA